MAEVSTGAAAAESTKSEQDKVMDIQAIVKLARYNPFWIDGVWGKESHKGIRSYLVDNGMDAETGVDALWEHLVKRLDTDQQFRTQVYMSAVAAVGEQAKMSPDLIELRKAAQVVFNLKGFGQNLVIDGDATFNDATKITDTTKAGEKVRTFLADEVLLEKKQDQEAADALAAAENRIAELEAERDSLGEELKETNIKLNEAGLKIQDLEAPETTALEIADQARSSITRESEDKFGVRFLVYAFQQAQASDLLDEQTIERKGRHIMDQFRDVAAYRKASHQAESKYVPGEGDVVFYGFRGKRVALIESVDANGNATYVDHKGEKHVISKLQLQGENSEAYLSAMGIRGFGDTSDLKRSLEEAKSEITQPASVNESLAAEAAGATLGERVVIQPLPLPPRT
jgi:hypothetical protein